MHHRRAAGALTVLLSIAAGCGGGDDGAARRATATATRSATAASSATPSAAPATATSAAAPTGTMPASAPTETPTARVDAPTPTATGLSAPTPSATPTATPFVPAITFFGIARADDLPVAPSGVDAQGRPVFVRGQGQAMTLILEARRGVRPLAVTAYDPGGGQRGVEFLVSRPLGDGSPAVCDVVAPAIGGVPGFDPPVFSDEPAVQQAIDDLGCRVNDGSGSPVGRQSSVACTRMEPSFEYGFVETSSDLQYCLPIARAWSFPVGDTLVVARVRDVTGTFSAPREIVIRVEPEQPFLCDQGIGERSFTVRRPASRLLTSAAPGGDASADPWLAGTLRICTGAALDDGSYPVSLREDTVLGLSLAGGGVLCVKVAARGSGGTLDCDGGSPADVLATRELADGSRVVVDSALGLDAGTGAALIRAQIAVAELAAGATPDACASAVYGPAFGGALTTAAATARLLAADQTVQAEVAAGGAPFACGSWREPGTGTLVLPLPIAGGPGGDRAALLLLSE